MAERWNYQPRLELFPYYAALLFLAVSCSITVTYIFTSWRYYQALKHFIDSPPTRKQQLVSPQIPFFIPWLGNTISFLSTQPGRHWDELFSWHPRRTGVCTLVIGGRKTHILFSHVAVEALFKAKTPSRDVFEAELFGNVFKMPKEQIHNAGLTKHMEVELNKQYLTKNERVNELTAHFTQVLEAVLDKDAGQIVDLEEIGLYEWLRDRMFTASTTALLGERLLQRYPEFCQDFFGFDNDFMSFFFKLPSFMLRDAIKRRTRIFNNLENWAAEMRKLSGGKAIDPEGPAWEPLFGSRLNRARQLGYVSRGLNTRSSAALDLGITFGLSSNVIPATNWMIMHILDPDGDTTVLPRVLKEVKEAEKPDGTLDISTLVSQPLLQSIWTECLRLYTDTLITRHVKDDLSLPLDEDGKHVVTFYPGDNVFAPSWLSHHDGAVWGGRASHDQFYADRFGTKDPKTGRVGFSMDGTNGKFFPFGGGKTICPGRVFAKQEALGSVAMILLRFDITVRGFVDAEKKPTDIFPKPAKAFAGTAVLAPGGDMTVKVRRRRR
ncbi:cytochrome P450 [Teratosphaeria nubilosa]|uniref:Cytochrome P450 n=1 Tax=Teratosphaeria nubilosa TaxID=161662 RepID=A0A6G1LD87_9PEZI|nr:cytochrome P450 [Teratosphaeria nubilosa]